MEQTCRHCGASTYETSKFCRKCGIPVETDEFHEAPTRSLESDEEAAAQLGVAEAPRPEAVTSGPFADSPRYVPPSSASQPLRGVEIPPGVPARLNTNPLDAGKKSSLGRKIALGIGGLFLAFVIFIFGLILIEVIVSESSTPSGDRPAVTDPDAEEETDLSESGLSELDPDSLPDFMRPWAYPDSYMRNRVEISEDSGILELETEDDLEDVVEYYRENAPEGKRPKIDSPDGRTEHSLIYDTTIIAMERSKGRTRINLVFGRPGPGGFPMPLPGGIPGFEPPSVPKGTPPTPPAAPAPPPAAPEPTPPTKKPSR